MTSRRGLLALAGLVLASGAAGASERAAGAWVAMSEACARYAETGSRDVAFGGWHVAFDGGGVCNGDPVCEDDDMVFVGDRGLGQAAVRVTVGAADWVGAKTHIAAPEIRVGERPVHFVCASAPGVFFRHAEVAPAHRAWITNATRSGRLVEARLFAGADAGPYLGCGHDGRPYQIEFSFHDSGVSILRLYYPAREDAAEGVGPRCGTLTSRAECIDAGEVNHA